MNILSLQYTQKTLSEVHAYFILKVDSWKMKWKLQAQLKAIMRPFRFLQNFFSLENYIYEITVNSFQTRNININEMKTVFCFRLSNFFLSV